MQEEFHPPLPRVTGTALNLNLGPAVDPDVSHNSGLGPLSCGPGLVLPTQECVGRLPISTLGGKPAALVPLWILKWRCDLASVPFVEQS